MDVLHVLREATEKGAADLFIVAGRPLSCKVRGKLVMHENGERATPELTRELIGAIYELAGRDIAKVETGGDDDFSFAIPGLARYRVSAYLQRGSLAAVVRVIQFSLPDADVIGIPQQVMDLSRLGKGLVLVTGPAGSGKSTTLACIIDAINRTKEKHIITLEDPIEYLHRHNKCIISQREVGADTASYVVALRAALRQSPDVILLGEMRDYETISIAMTAAETGHLVLSTLHTLGAADTIDRIIDVFPPKQQPQVRVQLSAVLQAVVSQQLLPAVDGGLVPAFELLNTNTAVRNMIRENKVHQLDGLIASSSGAGMLSMDNSLAALCRAGRIDRAEALAYAANPDALNRKL